MSRRSACTAFKSETDMKTRQRADRLTRARAALMAPQAGILAHARASGHLDRLVQRTGASRASR